MTFIACTEEGKHIPNPNVMVEYGYALRAKTHAAMLPVMNTAFGKPEKLPFDMRHLRHPIQYHVEPTAKPAERRAVREKLSHEIEGKIRLTLTAIVEAAEENKTPAPPFPEAKPEQNIAMFFKPNEVLANFGYPGEQEFRFEGAQAIYLRLFPASGNQSTLGLAKQVALFEARNPCPMSLTNGGVPIRNQYGAIMLDPKSQSTIGGLTQGFETGELWGVNCQVFIPSTLHGFRSSDKGKIVVIPMVNFETMYMRTLKNYVQCAITAMKFSLPFTIELGAVGLRDACLAVPGQDQRGEYTGQIMKDSIQRRYTLSQSSDEAIKALLKGYFTDFYDLAACQREDAWNDALIAAHDLPPR